MDFRELLKKIDTIAEADATGRIDYQANKAQDAREAAIAQVKQWMSTPLNSIARLGVAIDPKTGIIYYGDPGNGHQDFGAGYEAKPYPYDWLKNPSSTSTQSVEIYKVLGPAGLQVIPVEKKTLFGSTQVAGISPQQLADIDKPAVPTFPTPREIGNQPGGSTPPTVVAPAPAPVVSPVKVEPVKVEPIKGKVDPRGDDHTARLKALNDKLAAKLKAANLEERASITKQLVESFGYHIPEGYGINERGMLVELEWRDVQQGAADGLRGFSNGVTFGSADNIAAGVKSAFGKDTYAQALAKEKADTAAAEKRASSVKFKDPIFGKEWNPNMYDAGNLAGMIATPIPGGAVASGVARGTAAAAKAAQGVPIVGKGAELVAKGFGSGAGKFVVDAGTNVAATLAADAALDSHNAATLGKDWKEKAAAGQAGKPAPAVPPGGDPRVFALQQQLIAKGAKNIDGTPLVADGKMGKNTKDAMVKFHLSMPQESVAEAMARLRDRMALIEREQRGYSDASVDETLKGDVGKAVVDKASELGGKAVDAVKGFFGKGADAEAKAAAEKAAAKAPEKAAEKTTAKAPEKTTAKAPEKTTVHKADATDPKTIKNRKADTERSMGTTQPINKDLDNAWGKTATATAKKEPPISGVSQSAKEAPPVDWTAKKGPFSGNQPYSLAGDQATAAQRGGAYLVKGAEDDAAKIAAKDASSVAAKDAGAASREVGAAGNSPYSVNYGGMLARDAGAAERGAVGAAERDAASLAGREAGAAERDAASLAGRDASAAERAAVGAEREAAAAERAAGRTAGKGSNWKKWAGIAAGTGLAARLLSPNGGGDPQPAPHYPPHPHTPTPTTFDPPDHPHTPTPPEALEEYDFEEIVRQMKEIMAQNETDNDPEYINAAGVASGLIQRTEKAPSVKPGENTMSQNGSQAAVKESEDELARWLKIARG
jgi:hypothetical protein